MTAEIELLPLHYDELPEIPEDIVVRMQAYARANVARNTALLRAEIEQLRKMHQDAYQRGLQAGSKGLREMYDAVQTVKRQDAWGNAQLTEALMEAEERAERAEAENKQLRAEVERVTCELMDAITRADKLAEALRRYRNEVPLGHQPHMLAHEVDDLLREQEDRND